MSALVRLAGVLEDLADIVNTESYTLGGDSCREIARRATRAIEEAREDYRSLLAAARTLEAEFDSVNAARPDADKLGDTPGMASARAAIERGGAAARSRHTPGPWRVELDGYDSDFGYVVEGAGVRAESGLFVAAVEPHDEAHADIAANARLIAASPDLLVEHEQSVRDLEAWAENVARQNPAISLAMSRRAAALRGLVAKAGG